MEPSILFNSLGKLVDAEDLLKEEFRIVDLPLEVNNVTSEPVSQNLSAENCDPDPEVMFKKSTDPNKKSKPHFRKYYKYCRKSNYSVSNCFRKQRKDKKKKTDYLFPTTNARKIVQSIF